MRHELGAVPLILAGTGVYVDPQSTYISLGLALAAVVSSVALIWWAGRKYEQFRARLARTDEKVDQVKACLNKILLAQERRKP